MNTNENHSIIREPAANMTPALVLESTPEKATPADLLAALGVKDPAALLGKFPAGALSGATLEQLKKETGLKVALALFAAFRLPAAINGTARGIFLKPRDVWEELRDIREAKKEYFVVFYLDTRNQEIKREIVSIGTLNYNLVHPREVFEPAIRNLAASVIVCHNHPSGALEPSDEDLSLTKRLRQGGQLLGIELLDHVIVTKEGFMSFKQKGLI